jgi:hypothetical protein
MVTWVSTRRSICADIALARFAKGMAAKGALSRFPVLGWRRSAESVITRSSYAGMMVTVPVFIPMIISDSSVPVAVARLREHPPSSSAQKTWVGILTLFSLMSPVFDNVCAIIFAGAKSSHMGNSNTFVSGSPRSPIHQVFPSLRWRTLERQPRYIPPSALANCVGFDR